MWLLHNRKFLQHIAQTLPIRYAVESLYFAAAPYAGKKRISVIIPTSSISYPYLGCFWLRHKGFLTLGRGLPGLNQHLFPFEGKAIFMDA